MPEPGLAPTPDVPPTALGHDGIDDGEARATARLLVAPDPDAPDAAWVGVLIDLDPGWHTYWRNPGDTGLPTKLEWSLDGGRVGDVEWPTPHVYSEADGLFTTYGYEDRVLLQSPVRLEAGFEGTREITVEAHLLICKQECIPADFSLRRSFDEALVNSPAGELEAQLLADVRAALPKPPEAQGIAVEALYGATGVRPGDAVELAIAVLGCLDWESDDAPCAAVAPAHDVVLFPDADAFAVIAPGAVHARDDRGFTASFSAEAESDFEPGKGVRLTGVLSWSTASGESRSAEIDLPIPWQPVGHDVTALGPHWLAEEAAPSASTATSTSPAAQTATVTGLLSAIALALLGGLILNLMPCVLPVLAIKVFAVAELAERDRRDVIANGVAYTVGILASMGVLAAVVLGLRAAGTAVGWGFQFQSPIFIALVSMVLVAFALNLFGTWEIQWTGGSLADVGQTSTGWRRSFFEGLLAVVLSTPCSAPFLGTAVGFAFAGSALGIVAIFMAIGLGLAAPFLLVTLVPGAAAFFPRSGAWMLKLRAGLGFALLATVVWLLWIVGQTGGVDGMTGLAGTLLAFSFGLWVFGALQQAGRGGPAGVAALAVVAVALAGLNFVAAEPVADASEPAAGSLDAAHTDWRSFDPAAISAELAAGRPVFVAFSADWCITCKVNEKMVLARSDVRAALDRHDFVRFKADWTRRDEGIRAELARHGRAGVPLYLVYDPAHPDEPTLLPEILGTEDVIATLGRIGRSTPARASTETPDRSKSST